MQEFFQKNNKLISSFLKNLIILSILLLFLEYFTPIFVTRFISTKILLFIIFFCSSTLLFLHIKKDEFTYSLKLEPIFKYLFLFFLLLITLSSLNFEFLNRIDIVRIVIGFLNKYVYILSLFTIGTGFFTFYFNRERIDREIEEEEKKEKDNEERRKKEFEYKYEKINKIPVLRNIVKWMYKEGWWYSIGLVVIVVLFFVILFYDNNFINSADNYNVLGVKNLLENGVSYYKYSKLTDLLMLFSARILGFNFVSIKIPFMIYSLITLLFIYLTVSLWSKKSAFIASFLYVISPWVIAQSKITRDYSFLLMIGLILLYCSVFFYKKMIVSLERYNQIKYLLCILLIPVIILLLSRFYKIHILFNIIIIFPFLFLIINHYLNSKWGGGNNGKKVVFWCILGTIGILIFYIARISNFQYGLYQRNYEFFDIFFNPQVSSPWQWYHNKNFPPVFLFLLFFLYFIFSRNNRQMKYNLIVMTIFFSGLIPFVFKFQSHLDYTPVRYIYFLQGVFIILLASTILHLFRLFPRLFQRICLCIFLLSLVNLKAIVYSITPTLAFNIEASPVLYVDNIGVGRFDLLEVVNYLEDELHITDDTILVFDGRYGEFILYLDRPMDELDYHFRSKGSTREQYDRAKNTFSQSNFFGFSELGLATDSNPNGIFVTREIQLFNEDGGLIIDLNEETISENGDVIIGGTRFFFLKEINRFKIYIWGRI